MIEAALRSMIEDVVRKVLREELGASPGANGDEYLSVATAARVAEVAPATIRGWIAEGRLHRYAAGREIRVRRAELEALLAAPATSPEAAARTAFGGTRKDPTR